MTGKLSLKQGEKLVKLARKSAEYSLASGIGLGDDCMGPRPHRGRSPARRTHTARPPRTRARDDSSPRA